jgi:hypothetical protein
MDAAIANYPDQRFTAISPTEYADPSGPTSVRIKKRNANSALAISNTAIKNFEFLRYAFTRRLGGLLAPTATTGWAIATGQAQEVARAWASGRFLRSFG